MVRYYRIIEKYRFWSDVKWGSEPTCILNRYVPNLNLHYHLLNHTLDELEGNFAQSFALLSNVEIVRVDD